MFKKISTKFSAIAEWLTDLGQIQKLMLVAIVGLVVGFLCIGITSLLDNEGLILFFVLMSVSGFIAFFLGTFASILKWID